MAGIGDIFSSIKKAISPMGKAPAKPGTAQSLKAGFGPAGKTGTGKPFDMNLYMKAIGLFFDDFFNKRLPMFFKDPGTYLKKAPDWFKRLPQDEQISYGALVFGHVLFVVGIVLFIVL